MSPKKKSSNCNSLRNPDISNCYFLPLSLLEKVKSTKYSHFVSTYACRKSLLDLQKKTDLTPKYTNQLLWRISYASALSRAVCAHDWDRLQTLLSESPIWEQRTNHSTQDQDNYLKALIILLTYHPSARAQGLLHQFMHMVLACRSDEHKKALTKLLFMIPDKYLPRVFMIRG